MSLPAKQYHSYTYADMLLWDDSTRYELYDGEPVALASPSTTHQQISGELFRQIANNLVGKRCQVFSAPLDVCLFEKQGDQPQDVTTVVQPDLMVVCDPKRIDRNGIHGAPDLVIEILSDSSRRNDRLVKFHLYEKAMVPEYWIVDPSNHTVMVHLLQEGFYGSPEVYLPGANISVSVLDDCSINLNRVFSL